MPGKIQNNMKEVGLGLAMGLMVVAGIICSAGSFNYAEIEGALFVIAGILNIGVAVGFGILFYKRFLKPSK